MTTDSTTETTTTTTTPARKMANASFCQSIHQDPSSSFMVEDYELACTDGMVLRGHYYRPRQEPSATNSGYKIPTLQIVCWHGWLDNCHSFYHLAPYLMQHLLLDKKVPVELVALNLPGHGTSSHKSLDGPPMVLLDYTYYIHETLQALEWKPSQTCMLGHSLGGGISLLYGSAYPLKKMILLDSLGPHTKPQGPHLPTDLRKHLEKRLLGKMPPSTYATMKEAVETRQLSATLFPGKQYISKETAQQLVEGATKMATGVEGDDESSSTQVQFQHDPRLKAPSILYLTKSQVDQVLEAVTTPPTAVARTKVAIVLAKEGMPFPAEAVQYVKGRLRPSRLLTLPGSHHFHADPDHYEAVAQFCLSFLME